MVASCFQNLMYALWFSLAVTTHCYNVANHKIFKPKRIPFHLRSSNKAESGANENFKGRAELQDYFPTSGIETFISTIASRRMLLPTEYELSFTRYPLLKERYSLKKWPERRLEDSEDVDKCVKLIFRLNVRVALLSSRL